MSVYFVEAGDTGIVKIGKASDLDRRLEQIQPYCPWPLRVLAVARIANVHEERRVHAAFKRQRVHGEWFRLTPGLRALIAHVAKHQTLPEKFQEKRRWHRDDRCHPHQVVWNINDEPFDDGTVVVTCQRCGAFGAKDRQLLLLETLRRKNGRLPPLGFVVNESAPTAGGAR